MASVTLGHATEDKKADFWRRAFEAAKERADSNERDAERYRWARTQDADVLMDLYVSIPGAATPEEFDAVIDEAMAALIERHATPSSSRERGK